MKIKLSENIKNLRKTHSLTQEQLAEALGVTVGAVYKWEAGLSLPEIKLIMEIADFFEISLDVLLGYEQQNGKIENRIERIRQFVFEINFDEAALETEKALKKYPNNFSIVYLSASVYQLKYMDDHAENTIERSNDLFRQAISLLYQNTDRCINEITILNQIAQNYLLADKTKEALKSLEENNVCGMNNSLIGFIYAHELRKPNEARPFLVQSFGNELGNTIRTMAGMAYMYAEQKSEMAMEAATWLIELLDSLKRETDKLAFTDKYKAVVMAQNAVWYADIGHYDQAEKIIREAYSLAVVYDQAPVHSMEGIKFLNEVTEAFAYDDLGKTTIEAIEKYILGQTNSGEGQQFIKKIWEELKNEA